MSLVVNRVVLQEIYRRPMSMKTKEKKPITGLTRRLMRAMILFDQIFEVLDPARVPHFQGGLQQL